MLYVILVLRHHTEQCTACNMYRRWRNLPVAGCHSLGPDAVRPYHLLLLDSRQPRSFSPWTLYVPLFGSLVNLGLLYWKRLSHPINLVLLSTFTLMEAFTLGVLVAFFDNVIVLQALYVSLPFSLPEVSRADALLMRSLITLGVFLGLTLFTFQSKVHTSPFISNRRTLSPCV